MVFNTIKENRTHLGYSQEKLSNLVECSFRTIQRIENNQSIPSIEMAIKIKNALKIQSLDELFYIDNKKE
jgi:DNA-binding XRE family transcriptional regulator